MLENVQSGNSGNDSSDDKHHDNHKVKVNVDKVDHEVRAGKYLVAEFKVLVGVDAAKELDEVIKGTLTPLSDDATITIKGGEKFISHVRSGSSS